MTRADHSLERARKKGGPRDKGVYRHLATMPETTLRKIEEHLL